MRWAVNQFAVGCQAFAHSARGLLVQVPVAVAVQSALWSPHGTEAVACDLDGTVAGCIVQQLMQAWYLHCQACTQSLSFRACTSLRTSSSCCCEPAVMLCPQASSSALAQSSRCCFSLLLWYSFTSPPDSSCIPYGDKMYEPEQDASRELRGQSRVVRGASVSKAQRSTQRRQGRQTVAEICMSNWSPTRRH